jgi:carbon-monoxide dehydrogenase small subunit
MNAVHLDFPPAVEHKIRLDINGCVRELDIEPRIHLADALRDHCGLTATHIGCEHGVCGACTVQVDGSPQRSCLQSASRFVGRRIETLEAFDSDEVMEQLRRAFSAEHALQCGYCTPGMLITARDIVLRLPNADEARIREELAGNLCRCTGYQGIVMAIARVLNARMQISEEIPCAA